MNPFDELVSLAYLAEEEFNDKNYDDAMCILEDLMALAGTIFTDAEERMDEDSG